MGESIMDYEGFFKDNHAAGWTECGFHCFGKLLDTAKDCLASVVIED